MKTIVGLVLVLLATVAFILPALAQPEPEDGFVLTVEADVAYRVSALGGGSRLDTRELSEGYVETVPAGARRVWLFQTVDPADLISVELTRVGRLERVSGSGSSFMIELGVGGREMAFAGVPERDAGP